MEPKVEEKNDEGFLKIDTIWSEAEKSFENILVKEEAVSDLEPECVLVVRENVSNSVEEQQPDDFKMSESNEKNCDDVFSNGMITSSQLCRKRAKNKNSKKGIIDSQKLTCLHDAKNFKIVKRRLRCGNCRSVVCPECCKVMVSTLQSHFSGCDNNSLGIYSCKLCGLAFHSLCALQAHIRIHTMSTPYVCPDCGLIYNNIYFLILHLINKCYHVYKIARYKCKGCPGVYFSPEMFSQHVQTQHIEFVFKCSYCTSSFSNCEKFKYHMDTAHQKQKVQFLNYFRCSLCSDLIIPKIMYENHVSQHCDNVDSYETDYQCLCGYVYELIGGFRVHVQHCNRKGQLPPHWSFLQKKLKAHKKAPENKGGASHSNGGDESQIRKLNPSKTSNKNGDVSEIGKIQKVELLVGNNVLVKSDFQEARNQNFTVCDKEISGAEEDAGVNAAEEASNVNLKSSKETSNDPTPAKDSDLTETEAEPSEAHPGETDFSQTEIKINELPNIQSEEEYPKQTTVDSVALDTIRENFEENQINLNHKELEQLDPDTAKVLYDHIPRDHLGYVIKTQSSESTSQLSQIEESSSPTHSQTRTSPKNCHFVTELDEKTGLLTTKEVPAEDWEEENKNEEINNTDDDCDDDFDTGSFNFPPKFYRNGKPKFRVGNAFFTCPFCIVLFPKYNSTFQQFKLHLESYHPDAALNLTVENEAPEKSEGSLPENNKNLSEDSDLAETQNKTKDCNDLTTATTKPPSNKTSCGKNFQKNNENKKRRENFFSLESLHKASDVENSQDGSNDSEEKGKYESGVGREERGFYEDEKENLTREPSKVFKGYTREKNVCWTVKLSLQKNDVLFEGNQPGNSNAGSATMSYSCLDATKKNGGGESYVDQVEAFTGEEENSKCSEVCKAYFEKMTTGRKGGGEGSKKSNEKYEIMNQASDEDYNGNDCDEKDTEENEKEKKYQRKLDGTPDEKKTASTASDFGEDCEILKNLNWSSMSEISMKGDKNSVQESKTEEKERSRRESEVWSEFYESLKLAEKLKKNKEKKFSSHAEGKRKSVVSDYSTKRVVKKPKRYRESSESEYSFGGNENSDSDDEFVFQNSYASDFQSEKIKEDEDSSDLLLTKKQKLLSKLQNADNKFLDYLFELVSKKEKCSELYKKHSSLRASRYSQDLHSYRKKVLNGIKHRGRPHKLLRYQELIKKKSPPGEKYSIIKEIENQGEDKKTLELFSENSKSGEKKRGRPKKIVDLSKVKERRRSDKEVDFIEKNFEREENETSPSKRKRKLSSKLQYYKNINLADEKEDFSSGQVITNKPLDSSKKFCCAVCKEVFPEATEFREHILVHRMEENTYQCMECGECFVVRPSLEKHLHAFHKIKNTDKYITDNQCCNIRKEGSEVENEPLKENQCKVCKDQFDRAIDLTKHFRIHGMAFLKEFKREGKTK